MTTRKCSDRLDQANELVTQIDVELQRHHSPKTVLEQMRKSALIGLHEELETLARLLATDHYRLVFIGQVAVARRQRSAI